MANEQQQAEPERRRQAWTPRQVDSIVEQRIREAAERGDFQRLSTHGKPLQLDLKDAIDHNAWHVSRTMRSLGAVPPWMDLGKDIDADEARLRTMRQDFARWLAELRRELLPLPPDQRAARMPRIQLRFEDRDERYRTLAEELRAKIERFNYEVPVRTLEKPGVWVAHELRRLREPYAALLRELGIATTDVEPAPLHGDACVSRVKGAGESSNTDGNDDRPRRLLEVWRRLAASGRRRA